MAQTVNPATSNAPSMDTDLTASHTGSLQATVTAFVDALVGQGASAGASPLSGLGSTQAPTSPSQVATTLSNALVKLAQQQTDKAVSQVVAAQTSLVNLQAAAAAGDSRAQARLDSGSAQASLTKAEATLNQAVNNEISARVGLNTDAGAMITAGETIAARYANDPASSAPVTIAVLEDLVGRLVTLVNFSGLVSSSSLIRSAIDRTIVDFEKFSTTSSNYVRRPTNAELAAWYGAEKPSAK